MKNDKIKPRKLIIKLTDGTQKIKYKYLCGWCSYMWPDRYLLDDIKLELTTEEFLFLTEKPMPEGTSTQDIIKICDSLQYNGWKNAELYRICLNDVFRCLYCKNISKSWAVKKHKLTFPQEPYKTVQYDILNINGIDYELPKSIINSMETVNGMYESCGKKTVIIPDHYVPYISGIMELLLHKKNKYNIAEMSLLDFLGFPIELVKEGFIALDIVIPLLSNDHNMNLLEYGYIVSECGAEYPPKNHYLQKDWLEIDESKLYPLYMITPNVAELDMLNDNDIIGKKKDKEDIEELLLLKYLTQKYKKYL